MKTLQRHSTGLRRIVLGAAGVALGGLFATAAATDVALTGDDTNCCSVVELRQYTLHPARFDAFNTLFEREFIEPQEAAGITVIGQFRDLDDPNRFVWLRGFRDMNARAVALEAFYGGALWKSLRAEANASFTDTDDVLLLRPPAAAAQFRLHGTQRAAIGAPPGAAGFVTATIYALDENAAAEFAPWFEREVHPALTRAGVPLVAWFETDPTPNNFPRLPVREGERVFVWIAKFVDRRNGEAALKLATESASWHKSIAPELSRRLKGPAQVLRLEPTARSLLR
jgi:hypothetical protein